MKRIKSDDLSKLSDADLIKRLNDMRTDLASLRSRAARGTLKKELGEIKTVRRNIARALTQANARKASASSEKGAPAASPAKDLSDSEEAPATTTAGGKS